MTRHLVAPTVLILAMAAAAPAQQRFTDPGVEPTGPFPAVNDLEAVGTLTFYPDRESFRAVHPGLAMEDLTGTLVSDGDIISCHSPLDSDTSDACFPAGGVRKGFQFEVIQDGGWDVDYTIVNHALDLECIGIGPNFFVNETNWHFDPPVAAVAVDVYTPRDENENFILEIFGPLGSLGAVAFVTQGTEAAFFGADTVDSGGITSIEVREVVSGRGEVFCGLEFGNITVPVELQSVDVE